MLDSVTHELRTPLTSIKASVMALLNNSRLRPSQRNGLLIVINEEADRLNHFVGEAVETAQLDAGLKLNL
jgi:two-component system sensor histidine kinase KdpD